MGDGRLCFACIFPLAFVDTVELRSTSYYLSLEMKKPCNATETDLNTNTCVHEKEGLRFWRSNCVTLGFKSGQFKGCHFYRELNFVKSQIAGLKTESGKQREWWKRKFEFTENIISKSRVRWRGVPEQVIMDELIEPRTAFVTPLVDFHQDWQLIRRAMESMPSKLKFVTGKTEETVGLNLARYISSGYDDSTFDNFMTLRAAA